MAAFAARIISLPSKTKKLWGEPSQFDELFLPPTSSSQANNIDNNLIDGDSSSSSPSPSTCSSCGDSSDSPTHQHVNDGEKCVNKNCLRLSLVIIAAVLLACGLLYITRPYLKMVLLWMANIDIGVAALIFVVLFILVSFPMMWGYILLNVAAGYLYGLILGTLFVIVCALIGMSIAHVVTKQFLGAYVISKLSSSESLQAILRVVESSKGFKVVVLARLTPIPFGLQNGLFAISKIGLVRYLAASVVGLVPTQVLNSYIGTTLRSMEEVLTDSSNTITAYVIFFIQLALTVVLSSYVVRRARLEINKTIRQYDEQSDSGMTTIDGSCSSLTGGATIISSSGDEDNNSTSTSSQVYHHPNNHHHLNNHLNHITMNGHAHGFCSVPEVKVVGSGLSSSSSSAVVTSTSNIVR